MTISSGWRYKCSTLLRQLHKPNHNSAELPWMIDSAARLRWIVDEFACAVAHRLFKRKFEFTIAENHISKTHFDHHFLRMKRRKQTYKYFHCKQFSIRFQWFLYEKMCNGSSVYNVYFFWNWSIKNGISGKQRFGTSQDSQHSERTL